MYLVCIVGCCINVSFNDSHLHLVSSFCLPNDPRTGSMNVSPIGLAFLTEKPRLLSRTRTTTIMMMTKTAAPMPPPMAAQGMGDEAGDRDRRAQVILDVIGWSRFIQNVYGKMKELSRNFVGGETGLFMNNSETS